MWRSNQTLTYNKKQLAQLLSSAGKISLVGFHLGLYTLRIILLN